LGLQCDQWHDSQATALVWSTSPPLSRGIPGFAMGRHLKRLLRRILVFALGVLTVWFIVFVVFRFIDNRLPLILAVAATYGVAAYIILPRAVRIGLRILQRQRVPSYTITGDGLPGDPVNLALTGTQQQLQAAFAAAGWDQADRLTPRSAWRMTRAFVMNSPYPTAPFSPLYLFDRAQDLGFQKCIDDSPRKRHHVRFWGVSLAHAAAVGSPSLWRKSARPAAHEPALWVGAATKDTGFSLTWLTFQITHATDADTNIERDFIVADLSRERVIAEVNSYRANQRLKIKQVNHYVTDGEITAATLIAEIAGSAAH
jgi:hypothetical protein